ncbi:diguanylate cyclase [Proteiniborus sp. MB09-C3]|uniref:diguanylate cyclase n=1 Tax=Proteiniborus sp. MB09-C3 TaxID=3050072 RepID=UPI0025524231|nr:diguanylate cyclase [Proteiniborus sp. MB09-C3]WIV10497.1 diguanylate cyclase [Proteiniborus sp. MB09-C3]
MQLINNRYRIKKIYRVYDHSTIYVVYDLWNDNEELLLKLFSNDSTNYSLFKEFTDTFIELRSLRHKCIIPSYSFDIVSSIDNKSINVKQFFYTIDFIKGTRLRNYIGKMNVGQILSVIYQLLELTSYMTFRGYTYKYINLDNIFVVDDNSNFSIKLIDFATINERIIKNFYDEEYNIFTAPEVRMKQNNIGVGSDIYSIGMVLKAMLSGSTCVADEKDCKIANYLDINESQRSSVIDLVTKLIDRDYDSRIKNISEIAEKLNYIFEQNYVLNLTEERNVLIFGSRIIGRDKEINEILNNDSKLDLRLLDRQLISFTGEEGIGKTRLLKELAYRLKMNGRSVYHTSISDSSIKELGPIIRVLKSMLKDCDSRLIDIYGSELVKIIPEISESKDIKPSSMLSGTKERFRLYDRITKFIVENVKNTPTYVIIDDLHNCDIETINLMNYLINSSEQTPLVLIVSYDKDLLKKKKALSDTVNSWINLKKIYEHRLLRLNLDETSILIKKILGISYKPINFSTRVMNDTLGNPGHIEEAIKNLVATGELFINKNGNWDVPTQNYTSLYIPPNIGDAIKRQVKLLDKELLEVVKYISIFNTSVSKNIIKKIAEGNSIDTDALIDKLVTMKILDERVEDWGFTYDFYNRHIKSFIYSDLSDDEKHKFHRKAAEILENIYLQQDRGNIDELIYHYNMSMQDDKAVKQTILNAKKMRGLVGNIQCVHLWEKAYDLMKNREDKDMLEVLSNLGNLYLLQGMTGKSICSYEEGLKIAIKLNEKKYIAICNNGLSAAYYRKYDIDLSKKYAEEAKAIAEKNGYTEELLESVRIIYRIGISKGEYDKVFESVGQYLDIATKHGFDLYIGHFYNQMGITKVFTGQIDLAKEYFVISFDYFNKSGDYVESTRALNNIGYIYSDFLDDIDIAMSYYKEGIEISRKFQSLESEATFLNNIGELYIRTNNYEKAQEYIGRMESICKDIEDENSLFLSQINLGLVYLFIGKFDKCYSYYEKVNRTFNEGFVEDQNISRYYYFLSNFYLTLGNYDEALRYSNKILNSGQSENIIILDSRLKRVLLKYWMDGNVKKKDIDGIRGQYKLSKYFGERRKGLLTLAHTSILFGDIELAGELLLEDDELKDTFTTDYLDLLKSMLKGKLSKDYNILSSISAKANNKGFYEIEFFTNVELGDICFDNAQYYKSVNHYLTALDLLYGIAKKIPDKSLQITFINKNRASTVLDKLRKVVSVVKGNEIFHSKPIDFNENIKLEDFFNIKNIVDLFSEDIFNIEYKEDIEPEKEIAKSFEELILQLDNNYMHNLNAILNYAVSKTFASRGLIFVHDYESDQLITAASTSQDDFIPDKELIISEIMQKNKGIMVNKSFGNKGLDELLNIDDSIKAMICMPIFKLQPSEYTVNIPDRRKKSKTSNRENIIGYLYLDTDKLFNKFDSKRYKLIDALSHLISINIDNYILKIVSSIDKLTGVFTRKYFDSTFKDYISMARRDGKKFSVIMIDIDKFKNVNDTFGHRKGDVVLGKIGNIILENVRKSDIVGRYGGEEFIVILPNTTIKEGEAVAEKIRKTVEKSNLINESYPITISLGISSFPEHGQTEDELIEKADQASYVAKETGRNRSIVWSNDIGQLKKRLDKLAGIISGNTVKDQRIGLVIVEIIGLIKEKMDKEDKIFKALGRMIEILEAEQGILIALDEDNKVNKTYGRLRFSDSWIENIEYNNEIICKAINEQNGEFFIDWEDIREIDLISGKPNWQSVIVVPLINSGVVKGVLHITVPIKEKEFDYNSYNFVNTIGGIIAAML